MHSGSEINHRDEDSDAFFITSTARQRCDHLLQELRNGRQLNCNGDRPQYTFNLALGGRDWKPKMTEIYDATRKKAGLTFQDLNEIAILSGVLHVDEEHAYLSQDEIVQIRREALQQWSSIEMDASLAADEGVDGSLDTTPVIDLIMAAYEDCKTKNILPVLFMALHVFRKFNTWSTLRNEADCAMAMVGPILEEVLQIQHEVKFTSANFTTAHGKQRKQELSQQGSSRQPDIVGCTPGKKEIYFGELKGVHAAKQDVNVDILRLSIFAKDALDHLHCVLAKDPPLLTFRSKGKAVVFFLAAKQGNAVVHTRVSSIELPSNMCDLNLNREFFFRLFQVQSLLGTTRECLKNTRKDPIRDHHPFSTLGTPERVFAMRSPSKIWHSMQEGEKEPTSKDQKAASL
ncbi:hypothetical protein BGZ46_001171 [Entomortierella lignicola]|nr:hypothetical protein BGZ46_001171 [Entomortierella lignicola]